MSWITTYTYRIKRVGRGRRKTVDIAVTNRISLGITIEIDGIRYRVLDIVDLKQTEVK